MPGSSKWSPSLRFPLGFTPIKPNYTLFSYKYNLIFLSPVTEHKVENVVNNLKNGHSAGYDEFPEIIIKHCLQYIIKPLTHIFNLLFQFGTFPNMLIDIKN
jgi:hypothetical protein